MGFLNEPHILSYLPHSGMLKLKFLLLLLLCLFLVNDSIAMSAVKQPPLQFELSQVVVSLRHQTSRGLPGGYEITINGNGDVLYVPQKKEPVSTGKKLTKDKHVELINEFYRIRFFDLPDSNLVEKQVVTLKNNKLATMATKMADVSSKKLCITISDYKKCVLRAEGKPGEMAGLMQKIKALAGIPLK